MKEQYIAAFLQIALALLSEESLALRQERLKASCL